MPTPLLLPLFSLACLAQPVPTEPVVESATWPTSNTLRAPELDGGRLVLPGEPPPVLPIIALDPGHGVLGDDGAMANPGMETADCSAEEAFTLAVAEDLAQRLRATGHFEVILLRDVSAGPPYPDRWTQAEARGAAVLLSIHSDSRGNSSPVTVGERTCPQLADEEGFTVLFSMEGDDAMDARRGGLARALSAEMRGRGFPAYDGEWYGDQYDHDEVAGVFIDGRGLAMLRRPPMPSVILETHHAWHPDEWARWQEEPTRVAFAYAVARGLQHWLGEHGAPPEPATD